MSTKQVPRVMYSSGEIVMQADGTLSDGLILTLRRDGGLWGCYRATRLDNRQSLGLNFVEHAQDEFVQLHPSEKRGVAFEYVYLGTVNLETGKVEIGRVQ